MLRSLRAKMTFLVLALGVPLLLISVHGLLFAFEQGNLQQSKATAKRAFQQIARELQGPNPRSRIEALYNQSGLHQIGAGAALVNQNGVVLWESPRRAPGKGRRGAQQYVLTEGVLLAVMPEKQSEEPVRTVVFALTGLTLIAYGTGAWFLVGATLKPIAKLVDRVKESKSDAHLFISSPSTDREVVGLVDTLNQLIKDVRRESEERIQNYATLSHELRTPIHSLLLKLDLALGNESTKEELEAALLDAQRQVYRLKNLGEAVLTLQGLAQSMPGEDRESQDLGEAFDRIARDFDPWIELRSMLLDVQIDADLQVTAKKQHVELLIRNLLENAVKHGSERSTISVTASKSASGNGLLISNPANGQQHMAGNGLGLRICREIARANGWDLRLQEENGVFQAFVTFR